MKISSLFALLFVVVLVSGCDSAKDDDPTVTGRWVGSMLVNRVPVIVSMDLLENDQRVTGTGTIGTIPATWTGTHRYPDVSLVSMSTGFLDSAYAGTLSRDGRTIIGKWSEIGLLTDLMMFKQ